MYQMIRIISEDTYIFFTHRSEKLAFIEERQNIFRTSVEREFAEKLRNIVDGYCEEKAKLKKAYYL